jgi:hypothetical protein
MIPPYTLVCGVDKKHLDQLKWTWPTWRKHKPYLLKQPMIVFRDVSQVSKEEVQFVINHPNLIIVDWPLSNAMYGDDTGGKWTNPQRVKMLTGFVYIPAIYVKTKYWLKLDTDVVAIGQPDWIDENWFKYNPAMVCPPWGFTRPAHQMLQLDAWVANNSNKEEFKAIASCEPLNLHPEPNAERVRHKRICSWCGFFQTGLSRACVTLSEASGELYTLPSPSQDGLMWYIAKRLGLGIKRVRMKDKGWQVWGSQGNLIRHSSEVMGYA